MTRLRVLLLGLVVHLSIFVAAGHSASLSGSIDSLLAGKDHAKTSFSIQIVELGSGKPVFSRDESCTLAPASNMKLITTAAALDGLGEDFVFETIFGMQGDDLVVIGAGDPLTGDERLAGVRDESIADIFERVAAELKKRGIEVIKGDIVVDAFIFDDERFHPSWPIDQSNKWYAAEVAGLNFNSNCLDLILEPTQPGELVKYEVLPKTSYASLTNKCKTTSKGSNTSWASREIGTNNITIRANCHRAQTINVAIDRPSAFFATVMCETLLRNGISIEGRMVGRPVRGDDGSLPAGLDVVHVHKTDLKLVINRANRDSLNLAAEALLKKLGAVKGGAGFRLEAGSWSSGRAAVGAFLDKIGVAAGQYKIDDGSGLSKENRVSAECITKVLVYMAGHGASEVYFSSLATPEAGTLAKANRFEEDFCDGKINAKTGYINNTRSLSGYCVDEGNRRYAFSILTYGGSWKTKGLMDSIVKKVIQND